MSYLSDFGNKESHNDAMIAMALGVAISSTLVKYLSLENGQWIIWGVASVITGNVETSPKKFYDRLIGVSVGVPLGIVLGGYIIPSTSFDVGLATMGVFLTLVAFHRYVIAYTFRCFFVATTVMLVTHSKTIAFERLTHVIAGGLIGLLCVIFSRRFVKYVSSTLFLSTNQRDLMQIK